MDARAQMQVSSQEMDLALDKVVRWGWEARGQSDPITQVDKDWSPLPAR